VFLFELSIMYIENNYSSNNNVGRLIIQSTFFGLIVFYSLFFSTAILANTNAKGIQIDFIIDNEINTALTNTSNEINEVEILSLTPSPETAPFENNLWLRIQAGYGMPDITSLHTTKFENWYASKPDYVEKMMARTERYLFYVVEEVQKRGMPTEIALLPMIESAYNPNAYSRSHAAGIWQFIPSTGKHFGLKQNWWVDNRRHVTAATQAALDYLEKLHHQFGSWDLALAAYNAGEGTVGRAIIKNQKNGKPTDYQSLNLPIETEQYVPKLQAIKNIVTNPEQYGLSIAIIPNQAYFDEIETPYQIDAKLAAKFAEISHEEFLLLNPSYNRPVIASRNNAHQLLLPINSIETFENNLNAHNDSLISWKVYNAKNGERLADIAKQFDMSIHQLRHVNDLPKTTRLTKNLNILVPAKSSLPNQINVAKLADQKTNTSTPQPLIHKIKRGETLSLLAKKYGTNTKTLMRINQLKSTRVKAGQIIKVSGKPVREKTKKI
jgi:membrane-bound lytic murein transglycosylase D